MVAFPSVFSGSVGAVNTVRTIGSRSGGHRIATSCDSPCEPLPVLSPTRRPGERAHRLQGRTPPRFAAVRRLSAAVERARDATEFAHEYAAFSNWMLTTAPGDSTRSRDVAALPAAG